MLQAGLVQPKLTTAQCLELDSVRPDYGFYENEIKRVRGTGPLPIGSRLLLIQSMALGRWRLNSTFREFPKTWNFPSRNCQSIATTGTT